MPICMCMPYGLVTGTCVHSSTARGRLSKNSHSPVVLCVLSSILLPSGHACRGWRWSAAGRRMEFKKCFLPACKKNDISTQERIRLAMCTLSLLISCYGNKMQTGT